MFSVKLRTYFSFAVDHSLVYLPPAVEDDNTYINAVSVHVSHFIDCYIVHSATEITCPSVRDMHEW